MLMLMMTCQSFSSRNTRGVIVILPGLPPVPVNR
jgi:hypothetical protein